PDGPVDHRASLLVERGIGAHAIDLGARRKEDPLPILHAEANNPQILLEVELEDSERILDVHRGQGDRHERQDDIAFLDLILHRFLVDCDVAFEEMKPRVSDRLLKLGGREVHAVDLPFRGAQDPLSERVTYEPVDAEYENLHRIPLFQTFADFHSLAEG